MNRPLSIAQRDHVVDDDYVIAGVAGSLARATGIDALWVRLGFVLLTLIGGLGAVLYLGLWFVLSADPGTDRDWRRTVGIVVLVAAAPALLWAQVGADLSSGTAVLLLVGLAAALWRVPQAAPVNGFAPPLAAPKGANLAVLTVASAGVSSAVGDVTDTPTDAVDDPAGDTEHARDANAGPDDAVDRALQGGPREPRLPSIRRPEPSLLGRTALGLAIAVAAAGALIDQANGGRLHPEQWLGAAAVVCGLGLLVGTMRGRGRWLIVPALALAAVGYTSGTAARLGIPLADTFSDQWISVDGPARPHDARTTFGNVDIWIPQRPTDGNVATIDARTGFGTVYVRVDAGVPIEVRPRIDHGTVSIEGRGVSSTEPIHFGPDGEPAVIVDARVGWGDVVVWRQETAAPMPLDPIPPIDLPGGESMVMVSDMVAATADGWFVIANGLGVIDDQDRVVVGDWYDDGMGSRYLSNEFGEFRLLPRGLLVTPFGELLDLQAIRAQLAAPIPADGVVTTTTLVPSTSMTVPEG